MGSGPFAHATSFASSFASAASLYQTSARLRRQACAARSASAPGAACHARSAEARRPERIRFGEQARRRSRRTLLHTDVAQVRAARGVVAQRAEPLARSFQHVRRQLGPEPRQVTLQDALSALRRLEPRHPLRGRRDLDRACAEHARRPGADAAVRLEPELHLLSVPRDDPEAIDLAGFIGEPHAALAQELAHREAITVEEPDLDPVVDVPAATVVAAALVEAADDRSDDTEHVLLRRLMRALALVVGKIAGDA
jgi:hypothetical protein